MTTTFANYDPGLISFAFKGINIRGFADGTFITIERTNDAFSMSAGAAGDVVRVRNRDRTGTITVTLQAESVTNDLLSAVAYQDEVFGTGVGPILVKDRNGTTLHQADQAWIRKLPTDERSKDAGSREWAFDCANLVTYIGGAVR